jgi:hypothetical protein
MSNAILCMEAPFVGREYEPLCGRHASDSFDSVEPKRTQVKNSVQHCPPDMCARCLSKQTLHVSDTVVRPDPEVKSLFRNISYSLPAVTEKIVRHRNWDPFCGTLWKSNGMGSPIPAPSIGARSFAKYAKDGLPAVLIMPASSKAYNRPPKIIHGLAARAALV